MSYTFIGFFHCRRNFSLAVATSINRCQFETGFSLRGEVWVAFWNYSLSTQKRNEENVVRPHFGVFFPLAFHSLSLFANSV